jgi:hypothetical protein
MRNLLLETEMRAASTLGWVERANSAMVDWLFDPAARRVLQSTLPWAS